jgi:predicted RNA-binding protein with PIN domain
MFRSRSHRRRFLRGVGEAGLVLGGFVLFGLAWSAVAGARDAFGPPSYLVWDVSDPPEIRDPAEAAPDPVREDTEGSQPRRWLIDGFNVLHAGVLVGRDRREWWTEPRRRQLLDRVSQFDDPDAEVWVVFDGRRDPDARSDDDESLPRQVFADSADDWLVAEVRRADDPSDIAVVTADRAVADRARHRGAVVVRPRAFLDRCRS